MPLKIENIKLIVTAPDGEELAWGHVVGKNRWSVGSMITHTHIGYYPMKKKIQNELKQAGWRYHRAHKKSAPPLEYIVMGPNILVCLFCEGVLTSEHIKNAQEKEGIIYMQLPLGNGKNLFPVRVSVDKYTWGFGFRFQES